MDSNAFYTSPFFWALVSMFGLQGATLIVTGQRIGRNLLFVAVILALVTIGRLVLVLPLCPQPRFAVGVLSLVVGGVVLLVALAIAAATMSIRWWRAPAADMALRTSGVYAIVRHPIYLAELLWPIGWSVIWGSAYGLTLTPVWWLGFLFHALAEEDELERMLGRAYVEYKRRTRGRILPRLPV